MIPDRIPVKQQWFCSEIVFEVEVARMPLHRTRLDMMPVPSVSEVASFLSLE